MLLRLQVGAALAVVALKQNAENYRKSWTSTPCTEDANLLG